MRRLIILLSGFALTFAFFPTAEAAPEKGQGFLAHRDFMAASARLRFEEAQRLPDAKVRDQTAFEAMKRHLSLLYEGVTVTHSFSLATGQVVDCIPIEQQPALRRPEMKGHQIQPPPSPAPAPRSRERGPAAKGKEVTGQGIEGRDESGHPRTCPRATIPMRRVTLEEMVRFRTLEDFLRKKGSLDGANHYYAKGDQTVHNYGAMADLNLWSPFAPPGTMSISQIWVAGGSGSTTQTAEAGWQVYPDKYNTTYAVPFIFWTSKDYSNGCYNLDCPAFVQTNSSFTLGVPWTPSSYSVMGGNQTWVTYQWLYSGGNWWLSIGGSWIGYYPQSLYLPGQLAYLSTLLNFGGETAGTQPNVDMGSGRLPAYGYRYAAYQSSVQYYDVSSILRNTSLVPYAPLPQCYAISIDGGNPTYFYFGGPGC